MGGVFIDGVIAVGVDGLVTSSARGLFSMALFSSMSTATWVGRLTRNEYLQEDKVEVHLLVKNVFCVCSCC